MAPGTGAGQPIDRLTIWAGGKWQDVPLYRREACGTATTITGPADRLKVTDAEGEELFGGSLAHPPQNPPPAVARYPGPTGERANWWWYNPFQPQAPPNIN